MIGIIAFLQELDHRNNQLMLLHGALLVFTTKKHSPKQMLSTLIFELDRRFKLRVFEDGLLLQHLYGYNSVSFLKPATPLQLLGRLN